MIGKVMTINDEQDQSHWVGIALGDDLDGEGEPDHAKSCRQDFASNRRRHRHPKQQNGSAQLTDMDNQVIPEDRTLAINIQTWL
jgi:hypothetical protein